MEFMESGGLVWIIIVVVVILGLFLLYLFSSNPDNKEGKSKMEECKRRGLTMKDRADRASLLSEINAVLEKLYVESAIPCITKVRVTAGKDGYCHNRSCSQRISGIEMVVYSDGDIEHDPAKYAEEVLGDTSFVRRLLLLGFDTFWLTFSEDTPAETYVWELWSKR